MNRFATTLLSILISIAAIAQAPQAINYQGVARDLSGNPITNQNISLRITILQGSTTGAQVYQENHSATTNSLGLFELQIGNGTATIANLEDIEWENGNHYLQIELDESGGSNYQLIGTSQLLSVPYALHAESAENTYWNKNEKGIHYNEGNVGIGDSDPDYLLSISDTADEWNDERYFIKLTNHSVSDFSSVGIRLESGINGEFLNIHQTGETHVNPFTQNYSRVTSTSSSGLSLENFNPTGIMRFSTAGQPGVNEPIERMRITPAGNIGIGTQNPGSRLQIADGDVFIEDINNGVIMKSQNGQCWRLTIDNSGQLVSSAIACP